MCVSVCLPIIFCMPEVISMKLRTYIMAPDPTSVVYFINTFHQSVFLYVCHILLLGNGSVNTFPRNLYTKQSRILGHVDLYVAHVRAEGESVGFFCVTRHRC
jgi:hypothetical protein